VLFAPPNFPFEGVIVVADVIASSAEVPTHLRRDLEQTDQSTLRELSDAIRRLGLNAYHYEHPRLLAANAERHLNDIVLSIFGGSISRSRMALVPAVCEAVGLPFVGPDAYGRIICQDKEVSKALAQEVGLRVASHRIIRSKEDLRKLADFGLPYVAKPLWEGSSIGVGPDSLVTDRRRGVEIVEALLMTFEQPIMVETFIPGREVSYCFIEPAGRARITALAEIVWEGDAGHFDHHLYDARHKELADGRKTVQVISRELRRSDATAMDTLLQTLGPIGYGRIDGKLINGEFVFLEVTPDAWLGATGTFVNSFSEQGLSFDGVIAHLLLSGRSIPRDQSANG
jgi:D-alanine-D-alanine ligase